MDRGMPELKQEEYILRYTDKIGLFFNVNKITPEKLFVLRKFLVYPGSYEKYFDKLYCKCIDINYIRGGIMRCLFNRKINKDWLWA